MMRRGLIAVLGAVALSGCGPGILQPDDPKSGPELKRFTSEEELVSYFRDEVVRRNGFYVEMNRGIEEDLGGGDAGSGDGGEAPVPPGDDGAQGAPSPDGGNESDDDGGFSETTLQEEGVDESDVVKTDGDRLYVISTDLAGVTRLRIVSVEDPADITEVGTLELQGNGRDIYLRDDTVVAITSTFGVYPFPGPGIDMFIEPGVEEGEGGEEGGDAGRGEGIPPDFAYERPKVIVSILDVSDPAAPALRASTSFEGYLVSSRMIDGVLHLVSANYPEYYFDVLPLGTDAVTEAALDVEMLLPNYEITDASGEVTSGDVVTWQDVYHPVVEDGFGMVNVISLDTSGNGEFTSVGIVAAPGLVYASTESLYLTDTQYDFLGEMRETTDIYKFALGEDGATLTASGRVDGRILNQYSMGEYQGALRVAAGTGPFFNEEGVEESQNHVYVLTQTDTALNIVGRIDDIAPGESIQSARFVGPRGFLVTFEQIDPLFTLDLADPANPQVVGELKVPGFSTFIVPMDENHLLTVGQSISEDTPFWGVQLSIFDITDFAQPRLAHNLVVAQNGWSEALYDPKAFTYFAERGLVALPVAEYPVEDWMEEPPMEDPPVPPDGGGGDDGGVPGGGDGEEPEPGPSELPDYFEGLAVYSVSAADGFTELGRISTRSNSPFDYASFTRGVFIDDHVFAVTDLVVRGAPLEDVSSAPYEYEFPGRRIPFDPRMEVIIEELLLEFGFDMGELDDEMRQKLLDLFVQYMLEGGFEGFPGFGGFPDGGLPDGGFGELPPELIELILELLGDLPG